jgi:peptidylprolyl isomerase
MKKLFLSLLLVLGITTASFTAQATTALDPENTLYLDLAGGRVVIQMRPDLAPKHVDRIKELVRQGFYNGLTFHRVIAGFMAQTGDPTGTGAGGSGQHIPAEFTPTPFVRGTVGMARAQDINSADSQFFIMFDENPSLNNQYTVWGQVVSGMEFVDQIRKGEPPVNPDKIIKLQVAADADSIAAHANAVAPAPATKK